MNPFDTGFMPHGHCYFWRPELLWLQVGSDLLIALAYYSIPIALLYFVYKRKNLDFDWLFILFGIFILACGTTHVMSVVTTWYPVYFLEGWIKFLTGLISIATAILLWPTLPRLLALPSPTELKAINKSLTKEIQERQQAQSELKLLNRELEARVQQRTQQLARSNQELEQFAYGVSHDLRAPLRGIHNFAELLQERSQDLAPQSKLYLQHIMKNSQHMNQLITALLDYARLNQSPPIRSNCDLNRLLSEVLLLLESEIQEHKAQLCLSALPHLCVNAVQIRQVFQNLLSNALKFASSAPLRINIHAEEQEKNWCFQIQDNGIGFTQDKHERIFQIFQRLHLQDEYPGTGIGLATCKKIIGEHGGQIWAESQPGQSSTFYFTLPKSPAQAVSQQKQPSELNPPQGTLK